MPKIIVLWCTEKYNVPEKKTDTNVNCKTLHAYCENITVIKVRNVNEITRIFPTFYNAVNLYSNKLRKNFNIYMSIVM